MFKRKKKRVMLILSDGPARAIPLNDYKLPEEATIALSILYFNDPEPCHIHREAVRQRILIHLMDSCLNKGSIRLRTLPDDLRLAFPGDGMLELREEML